MKIMKTRRDKLRDKLSQKVDADKIEDVLLMVDEYEKANLAIISNLSRKRIVDARKITGGLKQCINSHGPITKDLIGSATKRIMGAMMVKTKSGYWNRFVDWIKN